MPWHRKFVSLGLLFVVPCFLIAQEPIGALLHGNGAILVNGAQFKDSTALMPGDVVQTGATGLAYISSTGSSSRVEANSLIRMRLEGMALDLGGLSVSTSNGTSVFARDYKIVPATSQLTEFYVIRSGGSIQIMARKGDVTVSCGGNIATVKESQQVLRNDAANCGEDPPQAGGGAPAAARGPILTSKKLEYAAFGVGAGLTIWVLLQSDNPVSPSLP